MFKLILPPQEQSELPIQGQLAPEVSEVAIPMEKVVKSSENTKLYYLCRAFSEENQPGYHRKNEISVGLFL
jgi:hypothetical protein